MFWILYKRICHKNIDELLDSISTPEKFKVTYDEIHKYNEYGIKS